MVWDGLLYAENMCCFYWLMSKAALVDGGEKCSQAGETKNDRKKQNRIRKISTVIGEVIHQNITGKPWGIW